MAVPQFVIDSKGSWRGKSKLNLPWLAPDKQVSESDSHLHIDCDRQNKFATIVYTWSNEGKGEEGTILLAQGPKSKVVELGWADSWHQSTAILHTVGEEKPAGYFKTKGTYKGDGEEWGWTIALTLADGKLQLKMENVTPKGEATWAVDATYERE